MYFNGDTANNYSYHNLRGDGTSLISYANTSSAGASPGLLPAANFTANRFGGMLIDIVDPFETTKFTTSRGHWFNIGTFKFVTTTSGNWRNTAAVDSIQLKDDNSQFAVNSTFDLYGLKDGA
jgi:hypothetical protein